MDAPDELLSVTPAEIPSHARTHEKNKILSKLSSFQNCTHLVIYIRWFNTAHYCIQFLSNFRLHNVEEYFHLLREIFCQCLYCSYFSFHSRLFLSMPPCLVTSFHFLFNLFHTILCSFQFHLW